MVTRRELGVLIVGAGGAAGAYLMDTGDPTALVSGVGDPMTASFPASGEFDSVRWREDGWITIATATDAEGVSLALAPGDVADPYSVDHVESGIQERGATVEFGLGEAIRNRGFEQVSIASYRFDAEAGLAGGAERVDRVTTAVPEPVLQSLGVA